MGKGVDILYEDNHIIAVNKKISDIVQGDKTGDEPLDKKVKTYIKEKYSKPGEVFLGVVHRIDRPVSGVVIFARTSKALSRMNNIFKEKKVTKIYWAIVKNRPPDKIGVLEHYIFRNTKQNKSYAYVAEIDNSKFAKLSYEVISESDNYFLLKINLETGRHHQIRAQLAAIGCPVKGDLKYGFDRSNKDGGISLHARSISFIHPVKNEPVEIISAPPDDKLWDYFQSKVLSGQ